MVRESEAIENMEKKLEEDEKQEIEAQEKKEQNKNDQNNEMAPEKTDKKLTDKNEQKKIEDTKKNDKDKIGQKKDATSENTGKKLTDNDLQTSDGIRDEKNSADQNGEVGSDKSENDGNCRKIKRFTVTMENSNGDTFKAEGTVDKVGDRMQLFSTNNKNVENTTTSREMQESRKSSEITSDTTQSTDKKNERINVQNDDKAVDQTKPVASEKNKKQSKKQDSEHDVKESDSREHAKKEKCSDEEDHDKTVANVHSPQRRFNHGPAKTERDRGREAGQEVKNSAKTLDRTRVGHGDLSRRKCNERIIRKRQGNSFQKTEDASEGHEHDKKNCSKMKENRSEETENDKKFATDESGHSSVAKFTPENKCRENGHNDNISSERSHKSKGHNNDNKERRIYRNEGKRKDFRKKERNSYQKHDDVTAENDYNNEQLNKKKENSYKETGNENNAGSAETISPDKKYNNGSAKLEKDGTRTGQKETISSENPGKSNDNIDPEKENSLSRNDGNKNELHETEKPTFRKNEDASEENHHKESSSNSKENHSEEMEKGKKTANEEIVAKFNRAVAEKQGRGTDKKDNNSSEKSGESKDHVSDERENSIKRKADTKKVHEKERNSSHQDKDEKNRSEETEDEKTVDISECVKDKNLSRDTAEMEKDNQGTGRKDNVPPEKPAEFEDHAGNENENCSDKNEEGSKKIDREKDRNSFQKNKDASDASDHEKESSSETTEHHWNENAKTARLGEKSTQTDNSDISESDISLEKHNGFGDKVKGCFFAIKEKMRKKSDTEGLVEK